MPPEQERLPGMEDAAKRTWAGVRPDAAGPPSQDVVETALRMGRQGAVTDPTVNEMRLNRRVNSRKTGSANMRLATERPRDPMFYWRENNLPYDIYQYDEQQHRYTQLEELRKYCRLVYLTHPLVASAIDIFSRWPLVGLELRCKDKAIKEFHEDLFFDELDYEDYLVDVGREYFMAGEAWPLGTFNELLGVWEDDELLNPDDVVVIRSPFRRDPRFEMRLPETLRDIIQNQRPREDYALLQEHYPELLQMRSRDDRLVVSNVLLKQLKFKGDTFHPRGIPLLMRGIRAVIQEEMLNSAQDAIASRLYTPLILAKLGASASDLGTDQPWIPSTGDIEDFQEALDIALAADFRLLTYHFGVDMQSVFGRETMPRLDGDFERLTDRILQVFGLSKTMLSGASSGQTYAADALNRDVMTQLLTTHQRNLKKLLRDRMEVVAEAQEHFDYEVRDGQKYPVYEEVLEVDPETGEQTIVEKPKLLIPDVEMKAMDMRDEANFRQFIEALRAEGVPISQQTRLMNAPIDLEEERERSIEEQVDNAVAAQEARKRTYEALREQNLPIPEDLKADFDPKAQVPSQGTSEEQTAPPSVGFEEPADDTALTPTREDYPEGQAANGNGQPPEGAQVVTLPRNRSRPPESDEQRAGMPKPAKLKDGPAHYGKRRDLDKDRPLDEQLEQREAAR